MLWWCTLQVEGKELFSTKKVLSYALKMPVFLLKTKNGLRTFVIREEQSWIILKVRCHAITMDCND